MGRCRPVVVYFNCFLNCDILDNIGLELVWKGHHTISRVNRFLRSPRGQRGNRLYLYYPDLIKVKFRLWMCVTHFAPTEHKAGVRPGLQFSIYMLWPSGTHDISHILVQPWIAWYEYNQSGIALSLSSRLLLSEAYLLWYRILIW